MQFLWCFCGNFLNVFNKVLTFEATGRVCKGGRRLGSFLVLSLVEDELSHVCKPDQYFGLSSQKYWECDSHV